MNGFFMVLLVKIKVKKLKWALQESNPGSIGERGMPLPLHNKVQTASNATKYKWLVM